MPTATWRPATRLLFRLSVAYFTLYVVFTQTIGLMTLTSWIPRLQTQWPMREIVQWSAKSVFGIDRELVLQSGSGDKTFDWVQLAVMLTLAVAITAVWSVLDRRRRSYVGLHKWFYLFMRFALGGTMMSYGMAKLIPLQMPFPPLLRLIEPYGNFSPMGVLWYSIGASRPYEMFTGSVEVLAGLLLMLPWTQLAGALVSLAAATQIFTLNMTYDVPVKLLSFHLILFSLFLLAPEAKRLLNVLLFNRTAPPSTRPPLARSPFLKWTLIGLQLLWCAWLTGTDLNNSINSWYQFGGGAAKPLLYGIWLVDEMTVDGQVLPPLLTDKTRWRRVIVQSATALTLQFMDESLMTQSGKVDAATRTIAMTPAAPLPAGAMPPAFPRSSDKGMFAYTETGPDAIALDGTLGGRKIQAKLSRYDLNNFLLMTRGFHWVQEYPFNR